MRRIAIRLTLLGMLAPGSVRAQEPMRNWPGLKVSELSSVYVLDETGAETAGRLLRLDSDSLTLLVDGAERRFEAGRVRRIEKRGDSLRNGALIGAVVGAALGAMSAGLSDCSGSHPGGSCPGARAGILLISTGVYAAVGTGIDALIVGRTTLYVAPTAPSRAARERPAVPSSGVGAAFNLRFAW